MSWHRFLPLLSQTAMHVVVLWVVLLPGYPTLADVLWRDDFEGSSLSDVWIIPEGPGTFLGRTQLRPPWAPLEVANGVVRLQLDTYNPTALVPGDSFWGSEIVTMQSFPRGKGLQFKARVRTVAPTHGGLVTSLFSWNLHPGAATRDEMDFEVLTNDLVSDNVRVLLNVFKNDGFFVAGDFEFVALPSGLTLTQWLEPEIRWLPDRVQWFINGVLVREEFDTIPDDISGQSPTIRLNIWAPASDFASAYDPLLQPTAIPGNNVSYFYEVDWVEISSIPEPSSALLIAITTCFLRWRIRNHGLRLSSAK